MPSHLRPIAFAALVLAGSLGVATAADSPAGLWDATVVAGNLTIPFKFEISGTGPTVKGNFFDGDLRMPSSGGSFENGMLMLRFDQFGAKLEATLKDDHLEGKYDRGTRGAPYVFQAVRASATPASTVNAPAISGEWRIPLDKPSSKGEMAWRFVVRQTGAQVSAAIMRVDGDTGTLSGSYKDGKFVLSHFSGQRPTLLEITPAADGSLQLLQGGRQQMLAVRPTDARAKAAPEPTDPTQHTKVADPSAKFKFSFPDVDGKTVTDMDARFRGKVVIVSVTGTWCPNCHDEAPFLSQLYKSYKSKGLEIVALSFEEPAQLKDLTRVRGFIKQYDITYPFLIAGMPEEASEKIPQAVNLNTFPAIFVLGKDGRVRATHAGYASKATGEFYEKEQKQFMSELDKLLAERAATQ